MPATAERAPYRRTVPPYTCGGCSNTWTPLQACHCSGCHLTFSGETLFARHIDRRGRHLDPADLLDRGYPLVLLGGVWRSSKPNTFR